MYYVLHIFSKLIGQIKFQIHLLFLPQCWILKNSEQNIMYVLSFTICSIFENYWSEILLFFMQMHFHKWRLRKIWSEFLRILHSGRKSRCAMYHCHYPLINYPNINHYFFEIMSAFHKVCSNCWKSVHWVILGFQNQLALLRVAS